MPVVIRHNTPELDGPLPFAVLDASDDKSRISLRFTLKTLLVAILIAALLIVWMQERSKRLEMTRAYLAI